MDSDFGASYLVNCMNMCSEADLKDSSVSDILHGQLGQREESEISRKSHFGACSQMMPQAWQTF